MHSLLNAAGKLFIALFLLLIFNSHALAQNKLDLEIKVQTATETARGGEKFSYIVTVTNKGSARATDVIFIQDEPKLTTFESYVAGKGTCETDKRLNNRLQTLLRCRLGNLEAGESVNTNVVLKFHDFGDASEKTAGYIIDYQASDSKKAIIGFVDAYPEEPDENDENNHAQITAELLPSRNIPPRVKIISPKMEEVITCPANKPCRVVFTIKAFDPDGTIEKVFVMAPNSSVSIDSENKYVIDGKKYSIEEVQNNLEAFRKYFGGEAKKIGKDTYTFTWENPRHGFDLIGVEAVDNGKRVGFESVRLTVKGDNTIEFTKPLKDSIIKPNTDLVIETSSKLNGRGGKPVEFQLIGSDLCCQKHLMKQISQNGNLYVHQYLWKNIPKGSYGVQVLLFGEGGAYEYSEMLGFKVTEKPTVKITSLQQMQVFKVGEDVPIEIEAQDADGKIEEVSISVDGKYKRDFSWRPDGYNKSGYISSLPKGIYKISAQVKDDTEVVAESEPITIIVK
ncbi:MAG TPA: Ig-like domain-containing protein [Pyrinomonadaceae bacterium]